MLKLIAAGLTALFVTARAVIRLLRGRARGPLIDELR